MNTRMLVPLVLVAGLMHGQQASATVLPYGNNPFKFCSEGMPSDGWVPVIGAPGLNAIRGVPSV